jgi:F-type H+-transporting ATPase subunit a
VSEATHASPTSHDVTHKTPRHYPVKRLIVLVLILIGAWAAFIAPSQGLGILKPSAPAVVLPAEAIGIGLPMSVEFVCSLFNAGAAPCEIPLTNVLLSVLFADLILVLVALHAWLYVRSGKLVPSGFYNFTEFLIEFLWNAAEGTAGKWARRIFPFTATIFLLVFASNLTKLLPFYETIGVMHQAHGSIKGYEPVHLFGNVYAIDSTKPVAVEEHAEEAMPAEGESTEAEGEHAEAAEEPHELCTACTVVPFFRAPATDLNFTFALAIVAVVMTQVFGFWSLGLSYTEKFFNTKTMFTVPMFGVIDFGVSILELVSEFSKILSFAFRLFGNIFAGTLLLSILGALTAVVIPGALYGLETFVGVIQAYVFSMLALVFMSQATVGHGHGDDHH